MPTHVASRLPNEISERIVAFAASDKSEVGTLWHSARQVSRACRITVAHVYLDEIIRRPERCFIFFDAGEAYVPNMEDGSRHQFGLHMVYDRMDDSSPLDNDRRKRVVFKESKETRMIPASWDEETKTAYKRKKYRAWKDRIEMYLGTSSSGGSDEGGCFDNPSHVINIRGRREDTALPQLKFDVGRQEISFEWEDMLYKFFREEIEVSRRFEPLMARLKKKADALRLQTQDPVRLIEAAMQYAPMLGKVEAKHRRTVRRARIMEHYRAFDDMWLTEDYPWNEQEQAQCCERVEDCGGFWAAEDGESDEEEEKENESSEKEDSGEEDLEEEESDIEESEDGESDGAIDVATDEATDEESDQEAESAGSRIDIDEVGWGNPEDSDTWDDLDDDDDDEDEDGDSGSDADSRDSEDRESDMYRALRFRGDSDW